MKKEKFLFVFFILIIITTGCMKDKSPEYIKRVNLYESYIQTLDASDPHSIDRAYVYFKNNLYDLKTVYRDTAFVAFRIFYLHCIDEINRMAANDSLSSKPMTKPALFTAKFEHTLDTNGIIIRQSSLGYIADQRPGYLLEHFSDYLSNDLKTFLSIRDKELNQGFSMNTTLTIPFPQVGERVITWEKFLNDFPKSLLLNEADARYRLYLSVFITGTQGTRLFNEDGVLRPDIKEAYVNFINKHNDTQSGKLVSEYYSLLQKNNFKYDMQIFALMKDKGIETMINKVPPER